MRDYAKEQSYYVITVWFKHKTKKYTISDYDKTMTFLKSAEKNETIVFYMVEKVSKFIYPEFQFKKIKQ